MSDLETAYTALLSDGWQPPHMARVHDYPNLDELKAADKAATKFNRESLQRVIAAAEARGRKQALREGYEAALTEAARTADKVTNQGGVTDCACPNNSKRSCGWRAGANEVAQVLYKRARAYAADGDHD